MNWYKGTEFPNKGLGIILDEDFDELSPLGTFRVLIDEKYNTTTLDGIKAYQWNFTLSAKTVIKRESDPNDPYNSVIETYGPDSLTDQKIIAFQKDEFYYIIYIVIYSDGGKPDKKEWKAVD